MNQPNKPKELSKLSDLTTFAEVVSFLERIDRADKISFLENGDIIFLEGCPRGIDITVLLKLYYLPELMDEDNEEGIIIRDKYYDEKKTIWISASQLRELHGYVINLARRVYLIRTQSVV